VPPGILALIAAFLFALAATLQQKGALGVTGVSMSDPASLWRLARNHVWLLGTVALLIGYVVQAVALDNGKLAIIQPLLVTTVVFALPLGYFLTGQHVGRREILGALVVIAGLALFAVFGDPAGGNENAPNDEWAIALLVIGAICAVLLVLARRSESSRRAAYYGVVSGMLFGVSACLVKPTIDYLHVDVGTMLSHWEPYAMAATGVAAFVLQQISLSAGFLATSVATVSVSNPVVSVTLGVLIFDERLSRPAWHVFVAVGGLVVALAGAAIISMATEGRRDTDPSVPEPAPAPAAS
jgi:drug/metabolite transporter (DMT)-like permease